MATVSSVEPSETTSTSWIAAVALSADSTSASVSCSL